MRPARRLLIGVFITLFAVVEFGQQSVPPGSPVALEPISAILDAFRTNQVVALGEDHGNEQQHAFIRSLIRDSRFTRTVNDIIVEFGNARYQSVIDRFVRGAAVSDETLRQVWQNTTQPHDVWDTPIYEAFYRQVRTVNASLVGDRQIRVLLGDPPIDRDSLRTHEDLRRWTGDPMMDRVGTRRI